MLALSCSFESRTPEVRARLVWSCAPAFAGARPMTQDVITTIDGRIGRIRLNRPKALHALNTDMCLAMSAALDRWRGDLAVEAVLIDHAEGRGFCAGGDIRMVAESAKGDGVEARRFKSEEHTSELQSLMRISYAVFCL